MEDQEKNEGKRKLKREVKMKINWGSFESKKGKPETPEKVSLDKTLPKSLGSSPAMENIPPQIEEFAVESGFLPSDIQVVPIGQEDPVLVQMFSQEIDTNIFESMVEDSAESPFPNDMQMVPIGKEDPQLVKLLQMDSVALVSQCQEIDENAECPIHDDVEAVAIAEEDPSLVQAIKRLKYVTNQYRQVNRSERIKFKKFMDSKESEAPRKLIPRPESKEQDTDTKEDIKEDIKEQEKIVEKIVEQAKQGIKPEIKNIPVMGKSIVEDKKQSKPSSFQDLESLAIKIKVDIEELKKAMKEEKFSTLEELENAVKISGVGNQDVAAFAYHMVAAYRDRSNERELLSLIGVSSSGNIDISGSSYLQLLQKISRPETGGFFLKNTLNPEYNSFNISTLVQKNLMVIKGTARDSYLERLLQLLSLRDNLLMRSQATVDRLISGSEISSHFPDTNKVVNMLQMYLGDLGIYRLGLRSPNKLPKIISVLIPTDMIQCLKFIRDLPTEDKDDDRKIRYVIQRLYENNPLFFRPSEQA